jgi:hypothetical protein
MSGSSTPSWSEFVKAHRAAAEKTVHHEAERIASAPFDWLGVPASGIADGTIGALTRHRYDLKGRRRIDPLDPGEE